MLNWIKNNKVATTLIGTAVIAVGIGVAVVTGKIVNPLGSDAATGE